MLRRLLGGKCETASVVLPSRELYEMKYQLSRQNMPIGITVAQVFWGYQPLPNGIKLWNKWDKNYD